MVTVRFEDPQLRDSCANFLRFSFPGTVGPEPHGLTLNFHSSTLSPEVAVAVVERLMWAWRKARNIESTDGTIDLATDKSRTG